jgi:hypothetical protein
MHLRISHRYNDKRHAVLKVICQFRNSFLAHVCRRKKCLELFSSLSCVSTHAMILHGKVGSYETFIAAWPRISPHMLFRDVG